jgi:hypothetical protein
MRRLTTWISKKRANASYFCLTSITTIHFFLRAIHDFRLKALCSSPAPSASLEKCYYYSVLTDRFAMYTRLVIHLSSNSYCRSSHRPLLSTFSHLIDIAVFFFFCSTMNDRSHSLLRIIIIIFYIDTIEKTSIFY